MDILPVTIGSIHEEAKLYRLVQSFKSLSSHHVLWNSIIRENTVIRSDTKSLLPCSLGNQELEWAMGSTI